MPMAIATVVAAGVATAAGSCASAARTATTGHPAIATGPVLPGAGSPSPDARSGRIGSFQIFPSHLLQTATDRVQVDRTHRQSVHLQR
uniref:Putative secreted protein n=1 Tax=Anopheles darlingi TaxID=43151 RepID=A0A2M4DBX2_ANODA